MARKKVKKKAAPVPVEAAPSRRTVSACLIVKNEERTLERCLASLAGAVDEIVVVDTGSTDGTVGIARKFGAKLLDFVWKDDFSAARNAALENATGDWILSIDADEWLAHDAARHFVRSEIQGAGNVAFVPYVRLADGSGYWANTRLFPREGSRWEYRIHEQVVLPRRDTVGVFDKEFLFEHDGSRLSEETQAAKSERNGRLLRRQLEESAPDSREWRHATIYLARQRKRPFDAEDEAAVEKGLLTAIGFDETGCQHLTYRLYRHWIEEGRFEEIERVNDLAWAAGARGPLIWFAIAVRSFEEGKLAQARRALQTAMEATDLVHARSELRSLFTDLARMISEPVATESPAN
ncbi:MAG: glycosyltransferase family 2 protein [Fimbriimonas sp.]